MKKTLRITGFVLILLGCAVLEFAVYEVWGTSLVTHAHQNALRKEFNTDVATVTVSPDATPRARSERSSPYAIARLEIPKIHVDVIVVEGVALSDLVYGPGRYTSTAKIGRPGTTAIAGHRTGWGSPFINLDRLKPDDAGSAAPADMCRPDQNEIAGCIKIETTDGTTYLYRVTATKVVQPADTYVLQGDPASKAPRKLALTTCTPKFTSRNRLIVWADLVKESKA